MANYPYAEATPFITGFCGIATNLHVGWVQTDQQNNDVNIDIAAQKGGLLMDLLMVEMNRNRLVLKIPVRFPVFFVIWTMLQFLFFIVVAAMPPLLRHHCVDVAGQLLCVN